MTFFTIKNIGLLLLLGVLVFPVGINQSHAQQNTASIANLPPTTPPIVVSAIQGDAGEIPFSTIDDDNDDFGDLGIVFHLVNDDVTNPASDISTQVTFDSDDFGTTDDASILSVTGETLGFTVNNNAIVGDYTLEYTVTDTEAGATTGNVIFTIVEKPNTAPTAENIIVQIEPRTMTTISFGDAINDAETDFDDLTITFSFDDDDLTAHQITIDSDDATPISGSPASFTVNTEEVSISESSSVPRPPRPDNNAPVPRTITLTYTVSDGVLETTATINIMVVANIIIPLNPNLGLDDRAFTLPASLSPEFERIFDSSAYADLMNLVDTFGLTGPQISTVIVGIDEMGSGGGTATFTTSESPFEATLRYTPATDFVGTETFEYSGMTERGEATGTFTFTVQLATCQTSLDGGVAFGELGVGVTSASSSLSISNDGNIPVQSLIQGANWVSTENTNVDTMNAGQTRYSISDSDAYLDRIPFTAIPVTVGERIADTASLDIYLQLFVELMDNTFRGATTQTMTVTSDCSVNP